MSTNETGRAASDGEFSARIEAELDRGWKACDIYQDGQTPGAHGVKLFCLIHSRDRGAVVICRTDWKPQVPPVAGMQFDRYDWFLSRHTIRSVVYRQFSVDVIAEPFEWKDRSAADVLQMLFEHGWYMLGIESHDRPRLSNFTGEFPELAAAAAREWSKASAHSVAPADAIRLLPVHDLSAFASDAQERFHPCVFYNGMRKEVVATDARRLAIVPVPNGPLDEIVISPEAIAEIRRVSGEWPKEGVLVWNVEGGIMIECQGRVLHFSGTFPRFPPYTHVMPEGRPAAHITVDSRMLGDICEHAKRSGDTELKLEIYDPELPLVARGSSTGSSYCLCGMVDDGSDEGPSSRPKPKRKR